MSKSVQLLSSSGCYAATQHLCFSLFKQCLFIFIFFIGVGIGRQKGWERKRREEKRKAGRERNPPVGSFLKYLLKPGLGQAKARRQELHRDVPCGIQAKGPGSSPTPTKNASSQDCTTSGKAGTWEGALIWDVDIPTCSLSSCTIMHAPTALCTSKLGFHLQCDHKRDLLSLLTAPYSEYTGKVTLLSHPSVTLEILLDAKDYSYFQGMFTELLLTKRGYKIFCLHIAFLYFM